MRYFIHLAYKGTNFYGWQVQAKGKTVQGDINNALSILLREPIEVIGCGRTDTGVHASSFYAHFDFNNKDLDIDKLIYKLNSFLSKDICIYSIQRVQENAHARFDAELRTYHYKLNQFKNPFLQGQSLFYPFELNIDLMNQAADMLLNVSDFESFCKKGSDNLNFICDVTFAKWKRHNDQLIFTISANRFLRNMVRAVVGTLLDVGREIISLNDFEKIIEGKNRGLAGKSIGAEGLYLADIKYPYINESKR